MTRHGDSSVSRRRFRWKRIQPSEITPEQKGVFMNMMLRKKRRTLNGAQQREGKYHVLLLIVFLVIIYASFGTSIRDGVSVTIEIWQIAMIGVWVAISLLITSILSKTKFISVLYWMLVYWPLLAILVSTLFRNQASISSGGSDSNWIFVLFIIAEVLTLIVYITVHHIQPWLLATNWFLERVGRAPFWSISVVSEWTMTYSFSWFDSRHTCKYVGEKNSNGMPHGCGKWMDDSYYGEILTGVFREGKPVAPFISRQYGTGDAFVAIPVAYFIATDDKFHANKWFPSNDGPSQCGVASVECSKHGAFYNHLPEASELYGPDQVKDTSSIGECCQQLSHLETRDENLASVEINASDPRGVQVHGHVYSTTGLSFSKEVTQVVVDIEHEENISGPTSFVDEDVSRFMPRPSGSFKAEHILVRDQMATSQEPCEVKSPNGEILAVGAEGITGRCESNKDEQPAETSTTTRRLSHHDNFCSLGVETDQEYARDMESPATGNDRTEDIDAASQPLITHSGKRRGRNLQRLTVRNWDLFYQRDALVYIPGFNSCLKNSLETLGQFMAMSNLSGHVYPICFDWPNGQSLTYRYASRAAATNRNKEKFYELLRGISAAGIRNVHFMSHSMGVQTLLGVFQDKGVDSRSDVSLCFRSDPAFCDKEGTQDESLMICKSITMLNPDFPMEAFVDHAFLSIRRVCNHITVVADRNDQALFYSQLINGLMNYWGCEQPQVLNMSEVYKKRGFHFQRVIGREVDSFYIPDVSKDTEQNVMHTDRKLLFDETPPLVLSTVEEAEEKFWLDIDVIDTTSLDINMNNLRHSGFNVNPILFSDLKELIVSGRRAAKRPALLHREGNIYSYCHAPSFVAM